MDLNLNEQRFLICGASSGFGRAVAEALIEEGAELIVVARRTERLQEIRDQAPKQVQTFVADLTDPKSLDKLEEILGNKKLHGAFINAGGPPALAAMETTLDQWDEAYQTVLRWKVDLTQRLLPYFSRNNYGRILFLESQSVKQPISSLVLSNAFRAAVTGFAKTLSLEVASSGITVNVLAPGSHATPAIERVIQKRVENTGKSKEAVRKEMEEAIPVGRMGNASELAGLAVWLLSEKAAFVTGQTLSHDGGNIKGLFG